MTFKEIQELIKLVTKSELAEFKVKKQDFELSIRTKSFTKSSGVTHIATPMANIAAPIAPAAAPVAAPAAVEATKAPKEAAAASKDEVDAANLLEVKSPIVGTFYRSASPEKPAFVKVGDTIAAGDVVCIVEAMKLFNEIESEISGKVVKVLLEDASPVEYDQVLFLVDPNG